MKKYFWGLFVFGIAVLFATGALAIEMSADVINKSKGSTITAKMYIKNNKIRMDGMGGTSSYSIVRGDLKKSYTVMPEQKMYMEIKHDENKIPAQEKMKGEVTRRVVGKETVDGHPTTKYEVTCKDGKRETKAYQWMATDLNFPIKTAAIDESWSSEYKNIKKGGQPDKLFEVPAGYKKMSIPSFPGMRK